MLRRGLLLGILGFTLLFLSGVESRVAALNPYPSVNLTMLRDGNLVKLRWSFGKMEMPHFPDENFDLQRSDDGGISWTTLGQPFNLPDSIDQLARRLHDAYQFKDIYFPTDPPDNYDHPIFKVAQQGLTPLINDAEVQQLWEVIGKARESMLLNDSTNCGMPPSQISTSQLDPTGFLLMASVDPLMAFALGLYFVDDIADVSPDAKVQYKVSGIWNYCVKGSGPVDYIIKTSPSQESQAEILPIISSPKFTPEWPDEGQNSVSGVRALEAITKLPLDRPEQQVTDLFYEEGQLITPTSRTPNPVALARPAVKVTWRCSPLEGVIVTGGGTVSREGQQPIGDYKVFPAGFNVYRAEEQDGPYKLVNFFFAAVPSGSVLATAPPPEPPPLPELVKVPALILPDTCGKPTNTTVPTVPLVDSNRLIEFYDTDASLQAHKVYWYQIEGVDLFGRKSRSTPTDMPGEARSVGPLPEVDLPPIPPQNVCVHSLRVPDDKTQCGVGATWLSDVDMMQKRDDTSNGLDVQLQWQWGVRQEEKQINNVTQFKVYIINSVGELAPCQNFSSPTPTDTKFVPFDPARENYALDFKLTRSSGEPVSRYYFCIATVVKGIVVTDPNSELFGLIDPSSGGETESEPSIPVTGYVVDMLEPKVQCTSDDDWKPQAPMTAEINPRPDWEGKVAVRLTWKAIDDQPSGTVTQYNIYRAFDDQFVGANKDKPNLRNDPNTRAEKIVDVYIKLNNEPIDGTVYVDHLESHARNQFYYILKAIDDAGNESDFSCASDAIQLPPPMSAPFLIAVEGNNERVRIVWTANPDSEQVTGYRIYRVNDPVKDRADAIQKTQDSENLTLLKRVPAAPPPKGSSNPGDPAQQLENQVTVLTTFVPAKAGVLSFYVVEAIRTRSTPSGGEEVVLNAFSDPMGGRAFDATPPKPPVIADTTLLSSGSLEIKIDWKLSEPLAKTAIWRRDGESGPLHMIAPPGISAILCLDFAGSEGPETKCSYTDSSDLEAGLTYFYALQAFDEAGNKSDLGAEVAVAIPPPCDLKLSGFNVQVLFADEAKASVDYTFTVEQGVVFARSPSLGVAVLSQGRILPYFNIDSTEITLGQGRATIQIMYGAPRSPLSAESDEIRFFLSSASDECRGDFATTFEFRQTWRLPQPPTIQDVQITPSVADPGQQVSAIVRVTDPDNDLAKVNLDATSLGAGTLTTQRVDSQTFKSTFTLKKPLQDRDYDIKITATDARGNTSPTITKSLTVRNVTPVITQVTAQNVDGNPGDSVSPNVEIKVRDDNADDTSQGRSELLPQNLTLTQPTSLKITPALSTLQARQISFDPSQGLYTFRFTPTTTAGLTIAKPHPAGQFTVTITGKDNNNASTSQTFSFTVRNVKPTVDTLSIDPVSARVGDGKQIQVTATLSDDNGAADITRVTIDARAAGGSTFVLAGNQLSRVSDRTVRATTPRFAHINQAGAFAITSFGEDQAGTRSDSRSVNLTVEPPLLPDLTVSASFSPSNPQLGATLTFDIVVGNQGNADAGIFSVEVRGASGPTNQNVSGLRVGSSTRLSLSRPCSVPNESFLVRVDPDNRVPESNETNNQTTLNVTCQQVAQAMVRLTFEAVCTNCGTVPVPISVFLQVNGEQGATPFTKDVIKDSSVTISAPPIVSGDLFFQSLTLNGAELTPITSNLDYRFTATANSTVRANYQMTSQNPPCTTEFSDSQFDSGIVPYVPKSGPTLSLTANPGHLRVEVPSNIATAGVTFDHWASVDEAPQVRCSAPTGDWEMTTRMQVLAPTDQESYHEAISKLTVGGR